VVGVLLYAPLGLPGPDRLRDETRPEKVGGVRFGVQAQGGHTSETIGSLAIERGEAASSPIHLVADRTANAVNGIKGNGPPKWHGIPLPKNSSHRSYVVLTHQLTTDGGDTTGLRQRRAVGQQADLKYWNILKPGGEVIGRKTEGGESRYYMKDHLGSIRAVLYQLRAFHVHFCSHPSRQPSG